MIYRPLIKTAFISQIRCHRQNTVISLRRIYGHVFKNPGHLKTFVIVLHQRVRVIHHKNLPHRGTSPILSEILLGQSFRDGDIIRFRKYCFGIAQDEGKGENFKKGRSSVISAVPKSLLSMRQKHGLSPSHKHGLGHFGILLFQQFGTRLRDRRQRRDLIHAVMMPHEAVDSVAFHVELIVAEFVGDPHKN